MSKAELASPISETSSKGQKSRILILCFDGTANQFDGENTNVVKFYSMLKKDIEDEQLCYYQTGVGTYENPGIMSPISLWVAKVLDEAIAWYLDAHVMGGYNFLMANYRVGDKICLFGFSRGAYTARALAGMLTKIGLLPRDNIEQVPFAYKLYTSTDTASVTQAAGFKQCFCRSVEIEFLGVWDTVASTGMIMSKTLPFTQSNSSIRTFRHALALDEHRAKFVPTFYHWPAPSSSANKKNPERAGSAVGSASTSAAKVESVGPLADEEQGETHLLDTKAKETKRRWSLFRKKGGPRGRKSSVAVLADDSEEGKPETDVKEVWFAGCHTDIGGGSVANDVASSLANVPLRWMMREVIASQCGIQFDPAAMARLNVHMDFPSPSSEPIDLPTLTLNGGAGSNGLFNANDVSSPTSDGGAGANIPSQDSLDCMQPTHDQLVADPAWWALEIIPLPFNWQDKNCVWRKKWEFHMGRGRYVQQGTPLMFHESVQLRMANTALKYTPRAKFTTGAQVYVS